MAQPHSSLHVDHPLPAFAHLHSLVSMSEKLREYLEVPQQFVQDGRQVGSLIPLGITTDLLSLVHDTVHQAVAKGYAGIFYIYVML